MHSLYNFYMCMVLEDVIQTFVYKATQLDNMCMYSADFAYININETCVFSSYNIYNCKM